MYPGAVQPLLVLCGVAVGVVLFLVVRRPVLRRLAFRQVLRRPAESALVVIGSLLGTTLIVASMVVGDSLDRSVRQTAYDVLGPVDETVRSSSLALGDQIAKALQPLRDDPRVDGVLTIHGDQAAVVAGTGSTARAEPRALAWDLDFATASTFGGAKGASGLDVPDPGPGRVVINSNLADSLGLERGDAVTFLMYGNQVPFVVDRVVPSTGIAGFGVGASVNRDAFFSPGTLALAASGVNREPQTITLVSNRGGVESGEKLTDQVTATMKALLGGLPSQGASLSQPKHEVLAAAKATGDSLASLFLFIASFSIIAGVLLLVNIFVMLADERKSQLGMLRAIGMRRRRVTGEFAIEGAVFGAVASVLGAVLGVVVGRVVVIIALKILNSFSPGDTRLAVAFAVRPASLINGMCAGFLIAFVAVVLTSVRISRTNIIAAIRDLEPARKGRPRRRVLVLSAVLTALLAVGSVPFVTQASSQGAMTYLMPAAALAAAWPLLRLRLRPRVVTTLVGGGTLLWGLAANIVCPHIYDRTSTATYVVMGTMLSFATVLLLTEWQKEILKPLQPLTSRSSEGGLAVRLAVAYPTARKFRTGATLAMYCLVVLVLVLLTQISAIISAGVNNAVRDASGGWTVRADYNVSTPLSSPQDRLTSGALAGQVTKVAPLVAATAVGSDPLRRTAQPLPVLAIGFPNEVANSAPKLQKRLTALGSDAAVWNLVLSDSRYVLIDGFYGATGGPQGKTVEPGDVVTLVDPRTGNPSDKVVAGLLTDASMFYGIDPGEYRYPVLMSQTAAYTTFGAGAHPESVLLQTTSGTDLSALVTRLQSTYLANGLVARDVEASVRQAYAANTQMFRLMQGYLALGLLVGICGLGVVMIRAVRERRRTIGVLRALGFRARTVQWSFLVESGFVALEGVVIGTVLGVVTTYLLYKNSPTFGTLDAAFPVAWTQISLTVLAALVASLLVTLSPARRAAHIRPAQAVRVVE